MTWNHLKDSICFGTSIQVMVKEAVRTDKVFLPQLMKQSIQFKVQLETIEVKEVVDI
jgi:hypothetical protein